MVINKIVFTSPEAMVEFSGEKIKLACSSKPFEDMQIYLRLKGQLWDLFSFALGEQKSPITNHTTTLCKECEIKYLTTQALSQLWITQSLLFPGSPFSLRVENELSFLERFLRSSWESNEHFLLSARAISRPVTCQVSMAGKHFIASILVNGNHTMLKMFVYHPRLK